MPGIFSRQGAQNRRSAATDHSLVFCLLFAGYLLLILYPILRADRYCNDDLIRALLGNYGWNNNGRHLANLLMRALQFGSPRVVDLSPLPQLIAVAILAWIGMRLAARYALGPPWLAALLTFPLGAQPFYLENLSYKFDAPCMAMAILCALWPMMVLRSGAKAWVLGVVSLLACLNFYQPAINVFLIFAILEVLLAQIQRSTPAMQTRQLLSRAAQALLAALIYQWLFAASLKDWMHAHGALIHGASPWDRVLINAGDFYRYLATAFDARWMALFAPLAMLAVAIPVVASAYSAWAQRAQRPRWQTLLWLLATLLLPCAAVLCIAGPMLLLQRPIVMPRVMLGVGALLCAALIGMHTALRQCRMAYRLQYVIAGMWALGFAVVASAYGNAATAQRHYETRIAARLTDDLAALRTRHRIRNYLLVGSAGMAPETAHAATQFPLLRTLVLPYLQANDFNSRNFLRRYLPDLPDLRAGAHADAPVFSILAQACAMPVAYTRSAYAIRRVKETAVVIFSKAPGPDCAAGTGPNSAPVPHV